jgi:hypothetical protein
MLKLFNLDLHISVIADIKNIINQLFGDNVQIINWSISGHSWVFNSSATAVDIINGDTWRNINPKMVEDFQKRYDDFLKQFDGFIVTHTPVFSMLYEKYNKPIILINSCRYEQPFSWTGNLRNWEWLNNGLKRMYASGKLLAVSNNKADNEYLFRATGINSHLIPSLCLYTNAEYAPIRNEAVVYGGRNLFPASDKLVSRPHNFKWSDLFSYKAIVHVPYEISTMSLFEHYSAGVPIFIPTKDFYRECIGNGTMHLQSIYGRLVIPEGLKEPLSSIDYWLDRADFYDTNNFKYIYYYSSFADLVHQIDNFTDPYKKERLEWIQERKNIIYSKWFEILYSHLFR